MRAALDLAREAGDAGDVPIGAVLLDQEGAIVAADRNRREELSDATAHAEMLALTQAESALGDWRLNGCDLYVTKEPCPMCAGAVVHCRVRRLVFGCAAPKDGAAGSLLNLLQQPTLNHQTAITAGVRADECAALLRSFFAEARNGNQKPKPGR